MEISLMFQGLLFARIYCNEVDIKRALIFFLLFRVC